MAIDTVNFKYLITYKQGRWESRHSTSPMHQLQVLQHSFLKEPVLELYMKSPMSCSSVSCIRLSIYNIHVQYQVNAIVWFYYVQAGIHSSSSKEDPEKACFRWALVLSSTESTMVFSRVVTNVCVFCLLGLICPTSNESFVLLIKTDALMYIWINWLVYKLCW